MNGEISRALRGAALVWRGDVAGFSLFDISEAGFWRSFRALPLTVALSLLLDILLAVPDSTDPLIVLGRALFYSADFLLVPLVMIPICRTSGLGNGYPAFVIMNNWANLLAMIVFALLVLVSTLIGENGLLNVLGLFVWLALLVLQWNVARIGLGTGPLTALGVTLISIVLSLVSSGIAEDLFG